MVCLTRQAVAGIAIISPQLRMPDAFRNIPASVPVAAIWGPTDTSISSLWFDQLVVDGWPPTSTRPRPSVGLAHRRPGRTDRTQQRLVEWRRTLERNNIDPPPPLRGEWSARSGHDMAKQLINSGPGDKRLRGQRSHGAWRSDGVAGSRPPRARRYQRRGFRRHPRGRLLFAAAHHRSTGVPCSRPTLR